MVPLLLERGQLQPHEVLEPATAVRHAGGGDLFTKKLDRRTGPTPSSYCEFVNSILEEREPLATGDQGLKVMKILEGIYRSAATGREVRYRP